MLVACLEFHYVEETLSPDLKGAANHNEGAGDLKEGSGDLKGVGDSWRLQSTVSSQMIQLSQELRLNSSDRYRRRITALSRQITRHGAVSTDDTARRRVER